MGEERMDFKDILFEKQNGIATVTINRPEVRNAFRTLTVDELVTAFQDAWWDHSIGVVIYGGRREGLLCRGRSE